MKITKLVTFAAALTVTAQAGMAQTAHVWDDPRGWWGNHFVYGPTQPNKFTAHEFSFDLFGSYWAGESRIEDVFDTSIRDGTWGGGVGVNYFLTREIGIGGDINIPDNGGNFVDMASGSLILRLPFETTGLAPYIYGGGGRLTDQTWEWAGHAGFGLEWRLNPITGIFADARYIWPEDASDSLLLRTGLRFVF
ncbi:MAG: hypothetical protein H7Y43_08525 [Akkermansiaceae bacterium]|nr:hypothetical protein [Verrucomicrobiales bacterium]